MDKRGKLKQGRIVQDSEWKTMKVPDVYFSLSYHQVSALIEPNALRPVLLEWKDDAGIIHLPLILREIPGTSYLDATSAYGYGGPWIQGNPVVSDFLEFLHGWSFENSIVCTFIRFHPLLDNSKAFSANLQIKTIGLTAGWDLEGSTDLVAGMAKGHRKTLRKALRSGVETKLIVNPKSIEEFVNLYTASMTRLSAKDFYHFPDSYWDALRDSLGQNTLLVEAIFEGKTIATAWCLFSDNYLHFHLSGTSDEARDLGAAVLCRVEAAKWGKQAGLSLGHFGGGVGGADSSLLIWKRKFDESLAPFNFSVANIIHDEDTFKKLEQDFPRSNFFPPWRDPEN